MFGQVPVNLCTTRTVLLANTGHNHAFFQVTLAGKSYTQHVQSLLIRNLLIRNSSSYKEIVFHGPDEFLISGFYCMCKEKVLWNRDIYHISACLQNIFDLNCLLAINSDYFSSVKTGIEQFMYLKQFLLYFIIN